jgi:hypothetical protein
MANPGSRFTIVVGVTVSIGASTGVPETATVSFTPAMGTRNATPD